MDALAAIVFSTVILNAIRGKVELTPKQEFSYLLKVGLIAAAGLAIVYAGLSYIGASFGGLDLVAGAEKNRFTCKNFNKSFRENRIFNTSYLCCRSLSYNFNRTYSYCC